MLAELDGYTIKEHIYRCPTTCIYRAIRQADSTPVILRCCSVPYPSPKQRFRLEFIADLLMHFDHPNIVRVLKWIDDPHHPWIVMEDIQGIDLNQYVNHFELKQLPIATLLDLAIQLTDALSVIHCAHVIHKGLHLGNLIVNPESGRVQIIDFGLASLLSHKQPAMAAPDNLDGSLSYISPEQTGRMNRILDYRTDFYTLGISLYQCLTGKQPFEAAAPLDIVYAHIAKQQKPALELRQDIPAPLSLIIDKLMNKNAEDRYQSALGLKHDLEICQQQWNETGTINEFTLDSGGIPDRLLIPQTLYGRTEEVSTLMYHFQQVLQGKPQLLAVTGCSGMGKSALVHEVHKPIAAHQGIFVSGKFDQLQQNIPYSALKTALKGWLNQVLSLPYAELLTLRQALLNALGVNARVLIDFMSEFKLLLNDLEAVQELGSQETQARFYLVFQAFIKTITQESALVIFIDDLQWADRGTLNLLPELMSEPEPDYRLLVIVAYRDNEVDEHHPVMQSLIRINKFSTTHHPLSATLKLSSLQKHHIQQLLVDTLHRTHEAVQLLADLVHQKTEGNPFFTLEFLKTLYSKALLNFDLKAYHWTWDIEAIKAESITDNVAELMLQKMQTLPQDTQCLLQLASCIGSRFNLETLAVAAEQDMPEVASALWPALKEGLLVQDGGDWFFGMIGQQGATSFVFNGQPQAVKEDSTHPPIWIPHCKFIHDRMLRATYESLDDTARREIHLTIGRLFYRHSDDNEREARVFELVEQLNNGMNLIDDDNERRQLAGLNKLAAEKAKQASVWTAAANYAETGLQLLPCNAWQQCYSLNHGLLSIRAECTYLNGESETAERLYEELLNHTNNDLDKAEQCAQRIVHYIGRAEYEKGILLGFKGLGFLRVELPQNDNELKHFLATRSQLLHSALETTPLSQVALLPEMQDRTSQIAVYTLINLGISAMLSKKPLLLVSCIKECLIRTIEQGKCDLTAELLAIYGLVSSREENYEDAFLAGKQALLIKDQYPHCREASATMNGVAFGCLHLKAPLSTVIQLYQQGYETGLNSGEIARAGVCLAGVLNVLTSDGSTPRKMIDHADTCLHFSKQKGLQLFAALIYKQYAQSLSSNQDCLQPESFSRQDYTAINQSFFQGALSIIRTHYAFWSELTLDSPMGYYQQALDSYAQIKNAPFIPDFYCFICLAVLKAKKTKVFSQLETDIQVQWGSHYILFVEKLNTLNTCYPPNHQHKIALIEAEKMSLDGEPVDTVAPKYKLAIAVATENNFRQYAALAYELYGQFLIDRALDDLAEVPIKQAYKLYQEWGCQPKIDNLPKRYAFLDAAQHPQR